MNTDIHSTATRTPTPFWATIWKNKLLKTPEKLPLSIVPPSHRWSLQSPSEGRSSPCSHTELLSLQWCPVRGSTQLQKIADRQPAAVVACLVASGYQSYNEYVLRIMDLKGGIKNRTKLSSGWKFIWPQMFRWGGSRHRQTSAQWDGSSAHSTPPQQLDF